MEVQPSIIGIHQSTYPLDAEIRYDTNIVNTGTKKIDNERFLLNYKFLFVNFFLNIPNTNIKIISATNNHFKEVVKLASETCEPSNDE